MNACRQSTLAKHIDQERSVEGILDWHQECAEEVKSLAKETVSQAVDSIHNTVVEARNLAETVSGKMGRALAQDPLPRQAMRFFGTATDIFRVSQHVGDEPVLPSIIIRERFSPGSDFAGRGVTKPKRKDPLDSPPRILKPDFAPKKPKPQKTEEPLKPPPGFKPFEK